MNCLKCGDEEEIVNKHFKLCKKCNQARLDENKVPKIPSSKKLFSQKPSNSTEYKIKLDEDFYEECFNLSNHECEECGKELPTQFRDISGKVVARWRYSHILPKSIFPELRHNILNINHLCLIHHTQWDFGDKQNMKIYVENRKKFPNYLK